MSKPIYVVGGRAYADIDVLACVAAYSQMLCFQGHFSKGVITGPWNQTIPNSIRSWPIIIDKTFNTPTDPASYILMDVSDPNHLEKFVAVEDVIEVYDHHFGYEQFWKERLPNDTHIEPVGACATLIWETILKNHIDRFMSRVNCELLYTAIFANTLNFQSQMTSPRDIDAANDLEDCMSLRDSWKAFYYQEIADAFDDDLTAHVLDDTKTIDLNDSMIYFGQVELWNAAKMVKVFNKRFNPVDLNAEWLVNIVSIEEGCSYLYCKSARIKELLEQIVLGKEIGSHFFQTERLWQRKELLREFMHKCLGAKG